MGPRYSCSLHSSTEVLNNRASMRHSKVVALCLLIIIVTSGMTPALAGENNEIALPSLAARRLVMFLQLKQVPAVVLGTAALPAGSNSAQDMVISMGSRTQQPACLQLYEI